MARLGGDEFADHSDRRGASRPRRKHSAGGSSTSSRQPFQVEGQRLHIGVSIGVALLPTMPTTRTSLLKNADIALYRAKQAGRGTFRFFEPHMDLELQARKALEYDLRQALLRDELELHYQPLIDLKSRRWLRSRRSCAGATRTRGIVGPGRVHPARRGDGPDHRYWRMGPAHGLRAGPSVAGSPRGSQPLACAVQSSRADGHGSRRSLRTRGSSLAVWSLRSPKAC